MRERDVQRKGMCVKAGRKLTVIVRLLHSHACARALREVGEW